MEADPLPSVFRKPGLPRADEALRTRLAIFNESIASIVRHAPRLIIAGLSGGSGKTIVSLGLARALARQGRKVKPFKKGPDYIDAAWLGLAAGAPATNLDQHFLTPDVLRALFLDRMAGWDLALIEGNRGLFDGKDVSGSCSTAELARVLRAPVVLVLDATKMTRTVAAVLSGLNSFEPGLRLSGVILNRTAGERHRRILADCIQTYTDVSVLGMLPKLGENPIPERHMGLMSSFELTDLTPVLDALAEVMEANVDLAALARLAGSAPSMGEASLDIWPAPCPRGPARIGVVHDAALWFYYPENIEALRRAGAEVVEVSILADAPWPELDGLYLGGGFPETQAPALAANEPARRRLKDLAESGLPIYAECGGFMVLCERLEADGASYPMAGVFPVATRLCERPQGLGYVEAEVVADNPFLTVGETVRGHEFHYSHCLQPDAPGLSFGLAMRRGQGMLGGRDGLIHKQTFAAYTHLHALGTPSWAPNFVSAAARFRQNRAR